MYGPLNHVINLSIMSSTFPDDMKTEKVTPLHKKKDKTHVGNYRPISVLSVVSKFVEKIFLYSNGKILSIKKVNISISIRFP